MTAFQERHTVHHYLTLTCMKYFYAGTTRNLIQVCPIPLFPARDTHRIVLVLLSPVPIPLLLSTVPLPLLPAKMFAVVHVYNYLLHRGSTK